MPLYAAVWSLALWLPLAALADDIRVESPLDAYGENVDYVLSLSDWWTPRT